MSILIENTKTENKDINTNFKPDFKGVEEVNNENFGSQIIEETPDKISIVETPEKNGNFGSLLNHISKPRPHVDVNPHLQKKRNEEEEEENETIEEINKNPEEENQKKQDPDFYKGQGQFAADLTDIAIPHTIAWLNDEKDETPYCAESRIKKQIAEAYARVFEEKSKSLSPTTQLLYALGMGYGIPLGMAGFSKAMKMINSYKEKKTELEKVELEILKEKIKQSQQPQQPQTEIKQEQNNDVTPKVKEEVKKEIRKTCLSETCEKSFIDGEGFGKGIKTKYYNSFCSDGCMKDQISLIGQLAYRNKEKNLTTNPKIKKKPTKKKQKRN